MKCQLYYVLLFAITVSVSCIDKGSSSKRVTTGGLFINVFLLTSISIILPAISKSSWLKLNGS